MEHDIIIRTQYFYIQKFERLYDFTLGLEIAIVTKGPFQVCFDISFGHRKIRINLHEKITWTK